MNGFFEYIASQGGILAFTYKAIFAFLIAFTVLVLLIVLVQEIRRPWYIRRRVNRAFHRAGLHNAEDEFPALVSVRRDKNRRHGLILKISNQGIPIPTFDANVVSLEASLNGIIYCMEYGKRSTYTHLYFLPRRYVQPTIISVEDTMICREPNCLVVGNTGSGKSYALLTILGTYARQSPDVSITICDYKMSSFAQFKDTPNFYGYEAVPEGIRSVYKEYQERLETDDPERNKQIRVLLIDEYGALISSRDRKAAEDLKTMVGNMLLMGRSLGIRVLVGIQRGDSENFMTGARDQFRAILGLGNLSKEQKKMLFSDFKDSMTERNGIGEGYLLIDGQNIERVKVAEIQDMGALTETIRIAMCR